MTLFLKTFLKTKFMENVSKWKDDFCLYLDRYGSKGIHLTGYYHRYIFSFVIISEKHCYIRVCRKTTEDKILYCKRVNKICENIIFNRHHPFPDLPNFENTNYIFEVDVDYPHPILWLDGTKESFNYNIHTSDSNGKIPSIIKPDGTKEYYLKGLLHREFDPAVIKEKNGTIKFYSKGKLNRYIGCKRNELSKNELPTIIRFNGDLEYHRNGKLYREGDNPAIIKSNGTLKYYKNNQLHRKHDKPAIIKLDGTLKYYRKGLLHRGGNKPAIIRPSADGYVIYYYNGKISRLHGKPAYISNDRKTLEYYVDGNKV